MKKRAFFAIVLALLFVVSTFGSLVAFAEETDKPEKGTVEGLSAKDNGYFYTNSQFTYTKNEDATSIYTWTFSYSTFNQTVLAHEDGIKDYVLANLSQATISTEEKVEIDATAENFYVLADFHAEGTDNDTKFSDVTVVCVDLTAPVVNTSKMIAWLLDESNETGFENSWLSGEEDWTVPVDWAYDLDIVSEENATDDDSNKKDMLNVYIQYLTAGEYYDSEWNDTEGSLTLDLTTVGVWRFRFVVADAAGNLAVLDNDQTNNSDKTYVYETQRSVRDLTKPTIYYTTTQKKVSTVGTAAGVTYSIPTPTYSDDMSSTKVTFEVQKLVNNSWVVIFDSASGVITEGYEDYVTSSSITPGLNEVTRVISAGSNPTFAYTYKVVHKVTDAYGNFETAELNILVTLPDADAFDVWKIVLISIACVAAAGIIVLLFVKPKEYVIVQVHGAEPVVSEAVKTEVVKPAPKPVQPYNKHHANKSKKKKK